MRVFLISAIRYIGGWFKQNGLKGENQIINDTKIQYLSVVDSKIYKVTDIDFNNLTIEAKETDLTIDDVPDNELWDMSYFGEFKIRLMNGKGKIEIIDMMEWILKNKKE